MAGRIIVKFRDGMSAASRLAAVTAVSRTASIPARPSYANFDVARIDPGQDSELVAAALRRRPDVEYAQAPYRVQARMVPTDQYYSRYQWNFPLIDLERAWDIQPAAASSIVVAVLDTGVAFQDRVVRFNASAFTDDAGVFHSALGTIDVPFSAATDLNSPGRFVAPHDFIWNDDSPLDLDGHGTHVSGTLGQLTNNNGFGTAGVAFNAKIMPVKILATEWDVIFGAAPEVGGSDDDVARGIRYAADNGAKIINMSIGQSGPANCGVNPNQDGCAPAIEDAIKYAVGKGVFVAIAGGNDFQNGNPTEVLADIASRVPGAVSVAAVDRAKNRAYYSGTGSWVELAAPGGSDQGFGVEGLILQQTLDGHLGFCLVTPRACGVAPSLDRPRFDSLGFFFYAGTSMATPHVAGVAAMLMQQGITNPAAIEAALERFATDLGPPGRDSSFGFGLVEARNTLRGLGLAQ
jgi:serine protease